MKKTILASVIAAAVALSGCSDSGIDSDSVDSSAAPSINDIPASSVTFNPTTAELSTPTDLLISTATGLVTIPQQGDIYESLSSLDGWGLGSPISLGVSFPSREYGTIALDESTVESADSVVLFDLTRMNQLTYGVDYIVKASSSGLTLVPLKTFKPGNQYLVAVTDTVKDSLGRKLAPSQMYSLLSDSGTDVTTLTADASQQAQLKGIQTLLTGINPVLSNFVSADSNIIYSTRFTAQKIKPVMQEVMDRIVAEAPMIGSVTSAQMALAASGVTIADNKLSSYLMGLGQDSTTAATATLAHDPLIYYAGVKLPYFLETPTAANCAVDLSTTGSCTALGSHWVADDGADGILRPGNYSPEKQSDHTVQVFISVPDENNLPAGVTKPENGWPVALYVHGITSHKETIAAMAGNLAAQGIAVVAIDLPLHGSRSIDMDGDGIYELTSTDSTTSAAYANGSSLVFANLSSLRTVRDNLRQSISDMLTLRAALTNTPVYTDSNVQPVAAVDLDGDSVSLIGVSLGSIIGTGVVGVADSYDSDSDGLAESDANNPFDFNAAALTVASGQAAAVMGYSNTFGPIVKAAFKANDSFAAAVAGNLGYSASDFIALRTTDPTTYDSLSNIAYPSFIQTFIAGAQQVVDSGDSSAWASQINSDTPVLVTQVVGNGINLSDQVVPNSIVEKGFPLAGTSGLISELGLTQASASTADATGLKVYTNFLLGKHSSLLDPSEQVGVTQDATSALAATVEMQTQVISFVKSQGTAISITNSNVVQ
ncbi:MAG: hypothetical protein CMI12_16530 [Oceanospirillum sp.]|nr:hypothetical protein [Oceanospirillum sp.]